MSQRTLRSGNGINRHLPVAMSAVLAFSTAKCGPEPGMNMGSTSDAGLTVDVQIRRDAGSTPDSRPSCNARDAGMVPSMLGSRTPLVADARDDEVFSFNYRSSGGTLRSLTVRLDTYTRDQYAQINSNISRDMQTLPDGVSPALFAVLTAVDSTTCQPILDVTTRRTITQAFEGRDSFGSTRSNLIPGGMMVYPNSITSTGAQFFIMTDYTQGWATPVTHFVPTTPGSSVTCSDFTVTPLGQSSLRIGQDTINSYVLSVTRSGMMPLSKEIQAFSDSSTSPHYGLVDSPSGQVFYQFGVRWDRTQNRLSVALYERQ